MEFEKGNEFERIWFYENIGRWNYEWPHNRESGIVELSDDDLIDYHIWQDINMDDLYKKHKPGTKLFRGKNPNIIFHGGCLGCKSQRLHGIDRCKGCSYFRSKNGENKNLYITGEDFSGINLDDFINFVK